jgi:hypothetical protein
MMRSQGEIALPDHAISDAVSASSSFNRIGRAGPKNAGLSPRIWTAPLFVIDFGQGTRTA